MNDGICFRRPTDREIKCISAAIANGNKKRIKWNGFIAIVFGVLAGLAILSIIFSLFSNLLLPFLILAASIVCVFRFVGFQRIHKDECEVYKTGNFKVIDGTISEIATNSKTIGCVDVWFESEMFGNGWYKVLSENVEIGTSALFVRPNIQVTKRLQCYVFTPFMLTEEGVKLHW